MKCSGARLGIAPSGLHNCQRSGEVGGEVGLLLDQGVSSGDQHTTDVCVIGAGPAGITVACALEGSGLRIMVVEGGRWWTDSNVVELAQGEIGEGLPYDPLERARAAGVGGTSLIWPPEDGLRSRPLDPIDFEGREGIPHSGWPISYQDYERYLPEAHRFSGFDQRGYDPTSWVTPDSEPFDLDGGSLKSVIFRFGSSIQVFQDAAERFLTSPQIDIMVGTTVAELCSDREAARVDRAIVVTGANERSEIRARVFVLAAGGIENARLLLLSRDSHSSGLGNHHDLVGRYFQEHLRIQSGVIVPSENGILKRLGFYNRRFVGDWQVTSALTLHEDVLRREGLLNFAAYLKGSNEAAASAPARAAAALVHTRREPKVARFPWRPYVSVVAKHPLQAFRSQLPGRALAGGFRIQLSFQSEQAPNPLSRITLGTTRDALGRPRARLEWRLCDLDTQSVRRSQELIGAELLRSNLGDVAQLHGQEAIPIPVRGFRHHIGTTRMHGSPRAGVVDSDCRVHGVNNLFVAGSSVFPAGGYANPTLSLVAMSLRLADHLRTSMSKAAVV